MTSLQAALVGTGRTILYRMEPPVQAVCAVALKEPGAVASGAYQPRVRTRRYATRGCQARLEWPSTPCSPGSSWRWCSKATLAREVHQRGRHRTATPAPHVWDRWIGRTPPLAPIDPTLVPIGLLAYPTRTIPPTASRPKCCARPRRRGSPAPRQHLRSARLGLKPLTGPSSLKNPGSSDDAVPRFVARRSNTHATPTCPRVAR